MEGSIIVITGRTATLVQMGKFVLEDAAPHSGAAGLHVLGLSHIGRVMFFPEILN